MNAQGDTQPHHSRIRKDRIFDLCDRVQVRGRVFAPGLDVPGHDGEVDGTTAHHRPPSFFPAQTYGSIVLAWIMACPMVRVRGCRVLATLGSPATRRVT